MAEHKKGRAVGGDEKSEAAKEAGKNERGESWVGLTSPDDALDVGETGAEARRGQR